jgi:hypothetical protein
MFPYVTEDYYEPHTTENMFLLAKEFNKKFTINWEWSEFPEEDIKMSPLQACVKYADGENILCPAGNYNHAIMIQKSTPDYYLINDSYSKENKIYCKQKVTNFIRYNLTINNTTMSIHKDQWLKDNDLKWVRNSGNGAFGRVMQGKLRTFNTTDRAVLCLLDEEVRRNGIQITNAEWDVLPQEAF